MIRYTSRGSTWRIIQLLCLFLAFLTPTIQAKSFQSEPLLDNRQPSLWTEDFGDCNGASIIEVSRFDAALYLDNRTVTFHLEGEIQVTGMKAMMFLTVYAYGEQRFVKIFDPCFASIES